MEFMAPPPQGDNGNKPLNGVDKNIDQGEEQYWLSRVFYSVLLNPLLPDVNYSYLIIKILFSKKEGIMKKFPVGATSMSR